MSTLKPRLSERDHLWGSLDAPLQLVEFGDFECPFCRRARPSVKALQQELGDRLCYGFRNFPLTSAHPHAELAAQAAEAAGAQGRFWEMHDLLFEHQNALTLPDLTRYAQSLELDVAQFLDGLRSGAFLPRIEADLHSGAISGVNGTPTFYTNEVRHDGSYDVDSLLESLTGGVIPGREL